MRGRGNRDPVQRWRLGLGRPTGKSFRYPCYYHSSYHENCSFEQYSPIIIKSNIGLDIAFLKKSRVDAIHDIAYVELPLKSYDSWYVGGSQCILATPTVENKTTVTEKFSSILPNTPKKYEKVPKACATWSQAAKRPLLGLSLAEHGKRSARVKSITREPNPSSLPPPSRSLTILGRLHNHYA